MTKMVRKIFKILGMSQEYVIEAQKKCLLKAKAFTRGKISAILMNFTRIYKI